MLDRTDTYLAEQTGDLRVDFLHRAHPRYNADCQCAERHTPENGQDRKQAFHPGRLIADSPVDIEDSRVQACEDLIGRVSVEIVEFYVVISDLVQLGKLKSHAGMDDPPQALYQSHF